MVPLVTRAMAHDTACRSAITGAFDHMLVDEYQDVNPGQLDLIAHFVAAGVKLWAVGDDDQTLYAFRASDIRTILDFGRYHPGARIHTLEVNYRAGAAIVDAAKALIRHNRTRIDKDYRPVLTEPGEIVIRGYSSPEIEARQVAAAIAELLGQGEAPGQSTILYRAAAIGLNFQTALKERQIPFEVHGSGDLWQSVGARLVVGALHYLHGGATVAAMSRLGTGQRSRIIVEHLDQIRPTVGHDFTLSCPHVKRIVGEALPAKASDRERNEWTSLVQSVVSVAVSCASLAALERRTARWGGGVVHCALGQGARVGHGFSRRHGRGGTAQRQCRGSGGRAAHRLCRRHACAARARPDLFGPPLRRCGEAVAVLVGDQNGRLVHLERAQGRFCRRPPAGADGSRAAASAITAQDRRHGTARAAAKDLSAAPDAGVSTRTTSSRADRAQSRRPTSIAAGSALVTGGSAPPERIVQRSHASRPYRPRITAQRGRRRGSAGADGCALGAGSRPDVRDFAVRERTPRAGGEGLMLLSRLDAAKGSGSLPRTRSRKVDAIGIMSPLR